MIGKEHTRPPWRVIHLTAPLDIVGTQFVIRSDVFAPGGIALVVGGLGTEEEKANAYLMAAAPEMYEVLKEIEWTNGGRCPQCNGPRIHQPMCVLARAIMRAEVHDE